MSEVKLSDAMRTTANFLEEFPEKLSFFNPIYEKVPREIHVASSMAEWTFYFAGYPSGKSLRKLEIYEEVFSFSIMEIYVELNKCDSFFIYPHFELALASNEYKNSVLENTKGFLRWNADRLDGKFVGERLEALGKYSSIREDAKARKLPLKDERRTKRKSFWLS